MIKYQEFTNHTVMELGEDGYWKATTSIIQKRWEGGVELRSRRITTVGINRNEEDAFNTAIKSLDRYFEANHRNLFDSRNSLEDETDITTQNP